jgi:hypothetical protein
MWDGEIDADYWSFSFAGHAHLIAHLVNRYKRNNISTSIPQPSRLTLPKPCFHALSHVRMMITYPSIVDAPTAAYMVLFSSAFLGSTYQLSQYVRVSSHPEDDSQPQLFIRMPLNSFFLNSADIHLFLSSLQSLAHSSMSILHKQGKAVKASAE